MKYCFKKRITSVVLFLMKKKEDKNNVKTIKKRNTYTTDRTDLQSSAVYSGHDTHLSDCGKWYLWIRKPTSGSKKGIHQFDRMYLFEDINFSTQDEEEKEDTCSKFETLLRSMNVSYKIIISNHYADNNKLREEILQRAVNKEMEPLAKEYHKMIGERLEEGRCGLLQSKYFVVSCRKPDYESAKTYFNTIEFSIQ